MAKVKDGSFDVDVAPEMPMYKLLQRLPYNIESALAEFVDNSLQSYLDHREELRPPGNKKDNLKVIITIDSSTNNITIEDDAAGIGRDEFQKAMSLGDYTSSKHTEDSLSVYGIGMKSAAVWLADEWMIETSSFGKKERLTTVFDLNSLLRDKHKHITVGSETVESESKAPKKHFTKISIRKSPRKEDEQYYKNTVLPRLQETFLKFPFMDIEVIYDNLKLSTEEAYLDTPEALKHPKVDKDGEPENKKKITWHKNIDITWKEHKIKGFVVLMEKGSYSQPGLRLFRNNRLIVGTKNQPNLPEIILGTSNKFAAQRIYGELHLNTVPVDFLKTSFDENLEGLYRAIKSKLQEKPNMVSQATNYRATKVKKKSSNLGPSTKKKTKPKLEPDKIEFSEDLHDRLDSLKNAKLKNLYRSLCQISLTSHAILAYVGMSVFFEVLSIVLGNTKPDGDKDPFDSFFSREINNFYANEKRARKGSETSRKKHKKPGEAHKLFIKDIKTRGNINKHEAENYTTDATELRVYMKDLTPFLIQYIDKFLAKGNAPD